MNRNKAFSLIEILIGLIVISAITAALSPLISKKISSNKIKLENAAANKTLQECSSADNCSEITISDKMSDFIISSLFGGGGGGAGASYLYVPIGNNTSCPANSIYINEGILGSGKRICMTQYNPGDGDSGYTTGSDLKGPSIPSDVTIVDAQTGTCDSYNKACCWTGQTALSGYCSDSYSSSCYQGITNYTGCKRTVCNYDAAQKICANHYTSETSKGDWRLPTLEEMRQIQLQISSVYYVDGDCWQRDGIQKEYGIYGLQLCDGDSDTMGSVKCYFQDNACKTNQGGCCRPGYIWSSHNTSSDYYYVFYLNYGRITGPNAWPKANPFSVRCVYELPYALEYISTFGGGGGSSATYIKNLTIPEDIISANIGGKIVLKAASAVSGGSKATCAISSTSNYNITAGAGYDGEESSVEVYSPAGELVWGIKAGGGAGGHTVNKDDVDNLGIGGAGGERSEKCLQYNTETSSWDEITCSSLNAEYGVGTSGGDGIYNTISNLLSAESTLPDNANGGIGGYYSFYSGGNNGNASKLNGSDATNYGTGGGGGASIYKSSNVTLGNGGSGAKGVAIVQYYLKK